MTPDELRNAAILLRRGSWVAPELFEQAADEIDRLTALLVKADSGLEFLTRNGSFAGFSRADYEAVAAITK